MDASKIKTPQSHDDDQFELPAFLLRMPQMIFYSILLVGALAMMKGSSEIFSGFFDLFFN